jgi:Mn2+/Fe2+ NRAMP family transporter
MAQQRDTYTGKGLAALIREQFSLRLTGLALFCVLLANTGLVVSEFAGIGAAFELVGVSRYLVILIVAVLIWTLVLFGLLPLRQAWCSPSPSSVGAVRELDVTDVGGPL